MRKMKTSLLIRLPLVAFLMLAPGAFALTALYVDGKQSSDDRDCKTRQTACKTIGHAISLASPGNVILVGPATYAENLTINFDLGIIGSGAPATVIDGQRVDTAITIPNRNIHLVLARITISNGVSEGDGGGIVNNDGVVTIYDSRITGNVAEYGIGESDGGGIYNTGTLRLYRSSVTQNETTGAYYCYGSGILNDGTLVVDHSGVSANSSSCTDVYGGGIYNAGELIVNNSTISGNSVADFALGGGIYNEQYGTVSINSSTISENDNAIGISNNGSVSLQNSILANKDGNCSGTITSEGYNLSSDDSCSLSGPGDLSNTDPKLGPLQNNGGPTQTQALLAGSPAIDAGNPNGCTDNNGNLLKTDQRGEPRPDQEDTGGCDIGAFERQRD